MNKTPFSIQETTVGLMVWNPTNEALHMQYAGISITMNPGEKQVFAIKCANHLLNGFGPRGLTSLQYGSDEDSVGKDAIQRNADFKKKQVIEYNQRNESRKQMGLGYLPPTPHIKKYAIELGLEILEPFAVRDEERKGISDTTKENAKLKEEMAELKSMMKALMEQKFEPGEPTKKTWDCDKCEESFDHHKKLESHKQKTHKE